MRYFKSTNGTFTIFRATAGREYAFGRFSVRTTDSKGNAIEARAVRLGFCNRPDGNSHAAIEITAAEYDRLTALKQQRLLAAGQDLRFATSPQDSWVRNSAIVGEG